MIEQESHYVEDPPGLEVLEDPYPDYDDKNSRVISGPLYQAKFPGKRFNSWRQAQKYAQTVGRVFKFWTLGPRWFARIARTNAD